MQQSLKRLKQPSNDLEIFKKQLTQATLCQLGVLETNKIYLKNYFRFEPKRMETQSILVVFRFVSRNQKIKPKQTKPTLS